MKLWFLLLVIVLLASVMAGMSEGGLQSSGLMGFSEGGLA